MLLKKSISTYYWLDKVSSYEQTPSNIDGNNKEYNDVSEKTQESLWRLLDNIWPLSKELESIYRSIDSFLNIENFSKNEIVSTQIELANEHYKLLWPEYVNKKEAQEAIKIYDFIFMDPRSSAEEIVNIVSKVFDDKDIPLWIKYKLSKSLREYYLSHMVYDLTSFDNIDKNNLDKTLTKIYKDLKDYQSKDLSIDDYNKLMSYEKILHSPTYKNNANAHNLQYILSDITYPWSVPYLQDIWKWNKIYKQLVEKWYSKYWFKDKSWDVIEYTYPWP